MTSIFFLQRKNIVIPAMVIFILIFYFGYQQLKSKDANISYATSSVEKGNLIAYVSGTGQVSTSNQVDLQAKVAGELTIFNIQAGQAVKEGDLLAQIDSRSAARKLEEARSSLENSQLELAMLLDPVDSLTLLQAENALKDAEESLLKLKTSQENDYTETQEVKKRAEDSLYKSYEDAYNSVASVFLDLPDIVTGLHAILYSQEIANSNVGVSKSSNEYVFLNAYPSGDYLDKDNFSQYLSAAKEDYAGAKLAYDQNISVFRQTNRYSSKEAIASIINQTLETVKKTADTVKSETNMLDLWVEYRAKKGFSIYNGVSQYQNNLGSYTSKTNGHLSSLLAAQSSIESDQESILQAERSLKEMDQNHPLAVSAAERSLAEKRQKLTDLQAGATELEIKSKRLVVSQKQNSLIEAEQNYADYFIRAPFPGIIASVDAVKGDTVSSGSVIATLITDQKITLVAFNEVDAAQFKIGQKANLTFDAVSGLNITGTVASIDTLAKVSSGVVSYDVKIVFDLQDERIKPGMSVSVNIITASKTDVLLVPLSAVKNISGISYVQALVDGQPQRKEVITGLSNDTKMEIIDGLAVGEEIITQIINNDTSVLNSSSGQNRSPAGFGGGEFRMLR